MYLSVLALNFVLCFLFSLGFLRRHIVRHGAPFELAAEGFVLSCLIFSVTTWLFIEGLSPFNALKTPLPLASLYLSAAIGFGIGSWRYRDSLMEFRRELRETSWSPYFRNLFLVTAVLIFLPLIFLAVFYPPRTADSMSYHMVRVVHWIQNGNIAIYPTNYARQIYYQPFAEYLMLPWQLFCGGDFFVNLVQVVALAGVLCLTILLVRLFGGKGYCQALGVVLVLSCPIALFEAPTTQTDIIVTFYFLSFLYSGLKLSSREFPLAGTERLFYAACMGAALGLGLNTKLSVGLFEIPFCIWFAFRFLAVQRRNVLPVYSILLAGFLLFNGPYFYRNADMCGNFLGPSEIREKMTNARFGPDVTFSNAARLIGLQILLPSQEINDLNYNLLIRMHASLGIPWNDHNTTFAGDGDVPFSYSPQFHLDDYRSGNILLLLLFTILGCGGIVAWSVRLLDPGSAKTNGRLQKVRQKKNNSKNADAPEAIDAEEVFFEDVRRKRQLDLVVSTWLMLLGFVLYVSVFRWQPFGARLTLPVFLGTIPFISVNLCRLLPLRRIFLFIPLLFGIALVYLVFNLANSAFYDPTRGLLKAEEIDVADEEPAREGARLVERTLSLQGEELLEEFAARRPAWETFLVHRKFMYYRNAPAYMADQLTICNKILESGYTKVGIAYDRRLDVWEYPLWAILKSQRPGIRIEWVVFPEYLKHSRNYDPDFVPEVLITDLPPRLVQEYYRFDFEQSSRYNRMVLLKVAGPAQSEESKSAETSR